MYKNQKNIPCNAIKTPKSKKFFEIIMLKKVNKIIDNVGNEIIVAFFNLRKKPSILKIFKIIYKNL